MKSHNHSTIEKLIVDNTCSVYKFIIMKFIKRGKIVNNQVDDFGKDFQFHKIPNQLLIE